MSKAPPPDLLPEPPTLLDRYLDNQLSGRDLEAFEQQLETDVELRAQVALQRQIDLRLGRSWSEQRDDVALTAEQLRVKLLRTQQASPPSQASTPAEPAGRTHPALWRSSVIRVAALVGLVAALGVGVWFVNQPEQPTGYAELQYVDIAAVYRQELTGAGQAGGPFEPDWVCDNQRFTETIQEKLGAQLALAGLPGDRAMLGLSYVARARGESVVMLGRHNGEPILVFFDRPNLVEQFYTLEPDPGLHVHQRDIGVLRVIELSPLVEPVFLDFLN